MGWLISPVITVVLFVVTYSFIMFVMSLFRQSR